MHLRWPTRRVHRQSVPTCSSRPIVPGLRALLGMTGLATMSLGACSFSFSTGTSPSRAAETLIEKVLGEQADMVFTDADCEDPVDGEIGTQFLCTATNDDGATVEFVAVIDPDDMVFVAPSNLVFAEEMDLVAQEAADVLGPEVGVVIDPADVDCPDETIVLDGDDMLCTITDAATGERYGLTVTFGEFVLREGYGDRFYAISAEPL